jgi:hypothetical protein
MAESVHFNGFTEDFASLKKKIDELVDRIYSPFIEVLGSFPGEGWDTLDSLRGLTPSEIQEAAKQYKKKNISDKSINF